jgi:hypothetical protein
MRKYAGGLICVPLVVRGEDNDAADPKWLWLAKSAKLVTAFVAEN